MKNSSPFASCSPCSNGALNAIYIESGRAAAGSSDTFPSVSVRTDATSSTACPAPTEGACPELAEVACLELAEGACRELAVSLPKRRRRRIDCRASTTGPRTIAKC